MTLTLTPGQVTLAQLETIYRNPVAIILDASCHSAIEASSAVVAKAAQQEAPVYGINTGFGKLASKKIAAADTATLQRNLILSHCAGVGKPLTEAVVRLIMALKLISLGRGASGVRLTLIHQLEAMLKAGIIPVIPGQGSVGASGDLAPLAHMSAVMMGEGEATYKGTRMRGADALKAAHIAPITLGAKEGLGLINGTQVSTALALAGLFDAFTLAQGSLISGALSTDAAMGSAAPFRAEIHELRGHTGQRDAAAALRRLLDGSQILNSHTEGDDRVQDPYCIRCQPQVVGACLDLLRQAARTLEIESNAATDNPLVLTDGSIVSGGNFHAEPVAFAADMIALAIAELGSIAQRRIALMVDPTLSFGLPPFLTPNPGLNSGFMVTEISAAALMSENKQKAAPCSVDSTPTSANQEDHVSMACHGARRLMKMNRNLAAILGIELLTGAQGIEFRAPLTTSKTLRRLMIHLRTHVPALTDDRPLHTDIACAAQMMLEGTLLAALGDAPLIEH